MAPTTHTTHDVSIDWGVMTFKADELKAIAHPARLAMLEILLEGEKCVCELMDVLDMEQAMISKHLRILKDAGFVVNRKEGQKIYYDLACKCVKRLLEEISKSVKQIALRREKLLKRL